MNRVRGFPYFPGRVGGTLQLGAGPARDDRIVVISQDRLAEIGEGWVGMVVVDGAPFSHAMIRLLGFGVPTLIVSAADARVLLQDMPVLLDAVAGQLLVGVRRQESTPSSPAAASPRGAARVVTRDRVAIGLRASIRSARAAGLARLCGAESIGLVRSEFLVPADGGQPDAGFYLSAFREIAEAAGGLPVTLRLLDLAVDKQPGWLPALAELNTPLGGQGPRLFDLEPVRSVFYAQLEALDRLSHRFDLRLLIPYLGRREEVRHWVSRIRGHMENRVPIGAMVETPAGALDLSNWFDLVDFAAVGCNDLMQCLFAADRDRPELREHLDPYAPVLYRFLRSVAQSARAQLDRIQLCGILPQLQGVLPLLMGLGFRAFSVEPRLIPDLAQRVRDTTQAGAVDLVGRVCAARETREVRTLLGLAGSIE
jgi:phosphoenolpyruvate-protein kinase (PTS system EI component)